MISLYQATGTSLFDDSDRRLQLQICNTVSSNYRPDYLQYSRYTPIGPITYAQALKTSLIDYCGSACAKLNWRFVCHFSNVNSVGISQAPYYIPVYRSIGL